MSQQNSIPKHSFSGLGIAPRLLDILERINYKYPTPIQLRTIPSAMEGKDIVGIAETGTGKTLAFGIPMLQKLAHEKGVGLILLPTRELAEQVNDELHKIGRLLGLRTAVLIGGVSIKPQIKVLAKKPHIIIATPGRLIDHMEQKTAKLDSITILILDEADRMLDMGFQPQIRRILQHLSKNRQTMLFSATIPHEIIAIATSYMKLPVKIEVAPSGAVPEKVSQEIFIVNRKSKLGLLKMLLKKYSGSTLIFTRTKYGAKRVARMVRIMGHSAAEIHSNRSQGQRRDALSGFKLGKYRVLVATDIASRGIDVRGIELVINFDFPSQTGDYVHRIGRTGRAGADGHAITFALPEEHQEIRAVERLIRKTIPTSIPPGGSPMDVVPPAVGPNAPRRSRSGFRPQRSSGFQRRKRRS